MRRYSGAGVTLLLGFLSTQAAAAQDADTIGRAFADNCFSPYLTAQTAQDTLAPSGARVDFYDLRPFSDTTPSPVAGRPATHGTDRRCEVAFDGTHVETATNWIRIGLKQERLEQRMIDLPSTYQPAPGTTFAGAVQLNPNRVAIAQAGTRLGPNGVETYLNVERLTLGTGLPEDG